MKIFASCLLLTVAFVVRAGSECRKKDWSKSFNTESLSWCDSSEAYITGFYRGERTATDSVSQLEGAECCDRPSPWTISKSQSIHTDWKFSLGSNEHWATCPDGYFLQGIYRSGASSGLDDIRYGRCSKPADHPNHYKHCYKEDIGDCFNKERICQCKSGYFVTGVYRNNCSELHCLDQLRCCEMESRPDSLDELYKVKSRIMDTTMYDIAVLAYVLGYAYCSGCGSFFIGEDFRRDGDKWVADQTSECKGYRGDERLSIAYDNWNVDVQSITFGVPIEQDLEPEAIDSGTIYNNDSTEATKTITRQETSVRSVTHTATSDWKYSHELGLEISYKMPSVIGGLGASAGYKFKYEKATSTKDENNKEQSNTFTVSTQKTLKPFSAASWNLVLHKSRTTVPYTATVIVRFSAELRGFLRMADGYNDPHTNYHYKYRGSEKRPTFNYTFGDGDVPFYTALKRQSESNSIPWLWHAMKSAYQWAQGGIDNLSDGNRYVFTLTGKFEDVVGKKAEFRWNAVDLISKRSALQKDAREVIDFKAIKHVAIARPNDPPSVNPDPPRVFIPLTPAMPIAENIPVGGA